MQYFELVDDVHVPSRWHLGEIMLTDGAQPDLTGGVTISLSAELFVEVTHRGQPLDFCLTSFAVPVARGALAAAIASIAGSDIQRIRLHVEGYSGFEVLNAVRVVQCLDENKSAFVKWTARDHRLDLIGQYQDVMKLCLNPTFIPDDAHFFRVQGWPIGLIVSERVKVAMENIGCLGAKFQQVTD
jgi:hypothetical protein